MEKDDTSTAEARPRIAWVSRTGSSTSHAVRGDEPTTLCGLSTRGMKPVGPGPRWDLFQHGKCREEKNLADTQQDDV